jgi:hypothetical protein
MNWSEQIKTDLRTLSPVGLSFAILAVAAILSVALAWLIEDLSYSASIQTGLLLGIIIGPVLGPTIVDWEKQELNVEREDEALYLDGKMKRYTLLFSVNGASFAIAKLLIEPNPPGALSWQGLSVGAILFTILMTADIWLWGAGMRNKHGAKLFRPVGQTILLMIGALLCAAWSLVLVPRSG